MESIHSTIKSVYNSTSFKYFGSLALSLHSCTYLGASFRSISLFFGSLHPRQALPLCELLSASFNIRPSHILMSSLRRRLPYGSRYLKTTIYFSIKPAENARPEAYKETLRELGKSLILASDRIACAQQSNRTAEKLRREFYNSIQAVILSFDDHSPFGQ